MLSFIKSLFSSKKENSKVIIKYKWAINPIKIYIAPLNFANYDDCKIKYRDMVVKAFNIWANASGNKINFEVTESLIDSNINIDWKRVDKNTLAQCYYNYNEQGLLYGAEISIGLYTKRIGGIDYDKEVYHSILHCVGLALGVSQTNNLDDIMCIPHQYGKIELSENDKKSIFNLYNVETFN